MRNVNSMCKTCLIVLKKMYLLSFIWGLNLIVCSKVYAVETWLWPLADYTNLFRGYFYVDANNYHDGQDILAPRGTAIRASKSGVVYQSGNTCPHDTDGPSCNCDYRRGNYVEIDHGDGTRTCYQHMVQGTALEVGTKVTRGQTIGQVGSSGYSTGYHLHFEIKVNGKKINNNKSEIVYDFSKKVNNYVDVGTDFYAYIVNNNTDIGSWKHIGVSSGSNNVELQEVENSPRQLWLFQRLSDGTYKISNANNGYVLDDDNFGGSGSNIQTYPWNDNIAQHWIITGESGKYHLSPVCADNCSLDIPGGSGNAGTNVQIWETNSTGAQSFSIYKTDLQAGTISVGVSGENAAFHWEKVDYADTYNIRIYGGAWESSEDYSRYNFPSAADGAILQLPVGHYYAAIEATNKLITKQSDTIQFDVLPISSQLSVSSVWDKAVFSWKKVDYADTYNIRIYKGVWKSGEDYSRYNFPNASDGSVLQLPAGHYYAALEACNSSYITQSDIIQFDISLTPENIGDNCNFVIKNINGISTLSNDKNAVTGRYYSEDDSQVWTFVRNSDDGSYTILNVSDGKALVASDLISVATKDGSEKQRWYVVKYHDDQYVLLSKYDTNKALRLKDSSTAEGTSIQLYDFNPGWNSEIFRIDKKKYNLDIIGTLDGKPGANIIGYGTCDIYINGKKVAEDVSDFYAPYDCGDTYEITDIKTDSCKKYTGISTDVITGYVKDDGSGLLQVALTFITEHTGNVEIRDVQEARVGAEGYTGNQYCEECGELLETGSMIKAIPLAVEISDGILTTMVDTRLCISQVGLIYGNSPDVTLATLGRTRITFTEISENGTFFFDAVDLADGNYYFRSYVIYKDEEGNEAIAYSNLVTF